MPATPKELIERLHLTCGEVIAKSLEGGRESHLSSRYVFIDQLQAWDGILGNRPEATLYETAQAEYVAAILSVCQGRYRNAFKSLRLTLELYLQGIFLSVDELSLREWLGNSKDTNWGAIVNSDTGLFSARFTRAFFPELEDRRKNIETLARTLYRELSECIHGNVPQLVRFPKEIEFSEESFSVFLAKCDTLRLIVHFSLSMRYLSNINRDNASSLEGILVEELGYLTPIRTFFGGVA